MTTRRLLIVPLVAALAFVAGCTVDVATVTVGHSAKAKQPSRYAIKYVEGDGYYRRLYVIEDRNRGKAHLVFVHMRDTGGQAAAKLDEWAIGDPVK